MTRLPPTFLVPYRPAPSPSTRPGFPSQTLPVAPAPDGARAEDLGPRRYSPAARAAPQPPEGGRHPVVTSDSERPVAILPAPVTRGRAPVRKSPARRTAGTTEGTPLADIFIDTRKALEAARLLKEQIAQLAAGDTEFIRDTLEGEIDFEEIARALLASLGDDEALMAGLKTYGDDLSARRDRIAGRIQLKRALLASALAIAERPKLELDIGTLSLTQVPPKAQVIEEADIPASYWQPQPPQARPQGADG